MRLEQGLGSSDARRRLFARFEAGEFARFSECERIEYFIYLSRPARNVDVKTAAESMLALFGGFAQTLTATSKEIARAEEMGPALAMRYVKLGKLLRLMYSKEEFLRPEKLLTVEDARKWMQEFYPLSEKPCTWQLCLNDGHYPVWARQIVPSRAWEFDDFYEGSLEDARMSHARHVILAQFCGRDPASVKPYDKKHAMLQKERLEKIGCTLVDVLLLDDSGAAVSMYERGMLRHEGMVDCATYFADEEQGIKILRPEDMRG